MPARRGTRSVTRQQPLEASTLNAYARSNCRTICSSSPPVVVAARMLSTGTAGCSIMGAVSPRERIDPCLFTRPSVSQRLRSFAPLSLPRVAPNDANGCRCGPGPGRRRREQHGLRCGRVANRRDPSRRHGTRCRRRGERSRRLDSGGCVRRAGFIERPCACQPPRRRRRVHDDSTPRRLRGQRRRRNVRDGQRLHIRKHGPLH